MDLSGYVIVFDFDGVLANNGVLFIDAINELQTLAAQNALICLASFNYYAIDILRHNGIGNIFAAYRCGRSDYTPIKHSFDSVTYQNMLTKSQQILSMIEELDHKKIIPDPKLPTMFIYPKVIFFDDDPYNIHDTMMCNDINCWSVKIDPNVGLMANILEHIQSIMKSWNTKYTWINVFETIYD